MKRIGLISDTHNDIDPKVYKYFEECDEIWHAGDVGNSSVTDELAKFKPIKAVYGNIDGQDIRIQFPKTLRFMCEGVDVFIIHIGGYPNRYAPSVKKYLHKFPPKLFICGHSHILKVIYDKKLGLLHMNPGAAGNSGIHKVKTLLRFTIDGKDIKDLEIIEMGPRG